MIDKYWKITNFDVGREFYNPNWVDDMIEWNEKIINECKPVVEAAIKFREFFSSDDLNSTVREFVKTIDKYLKRE